MLIFSRLSGEVLHVGDNISVTVLNVHGGQVRLGIGAPKEVPVHREEVYRQIQKQAKAKVSAIADHAGGS